MKAATHAERQQRACQPTVELLLRLPQQLGGGSCEAGGLLAGIIQ
jgi:hypothetical protein